MAKSKSIALPSLLSFERKIEVSDALMFSGRWQGDKWDAIPITKRQNRSTQSAYGTEDKKKAEANPVSSDSDDANLFSEHDSLNVKFTLRTIGDVGNPFACNEPDFESVFKENIAVDKEECLRELAYRYAHNIASGRFLWRNRINAKEAKVVVTIGDKDIPFNCFDFPLREFETQRNNADLNELANVLYSGLSANVDDSIFVLINVSAFVLLGNGQHVFPSQEMNMGEKKKVLFKLNDCAAMHSVKVANAIRTIDTWYKDAEFPIAAEPFGAVTQKGQAYRKNGDDLYTLMQNMVNGGEISKEDRSFILANLIRGGVFSGESKKKAG